MKRWVCAGLLAGLLSTGCEGRPRSGALVESRADEGPTGPGKVAVFDLSQGVPESTETGGFFPLPAVRTFTGLVRSIERLVAEPDADGVFLRLGSTQLGWAQVEELAELFAKIRARGTPVTCHAHDLGNASAWLAARACSQIWLSPAGNADTVGIAAQVLYFKPALEKLHVQADFLQMGRFKSAAEPMTREGPTEAARESLTAVLKSIRATWIEGYQKSGRAPAAIEALESGPWSAEEAKARGLVDVIGYESDALAQLRKSLDAGTVRVAFGPEAPAGGTSVAELIRIVAGADEAMGGRPHVAVIVAEGAIAMEAGGVLDGGGIAARALSKTLRRLAQDDTVKAVVLRIDSPGGSALASDLLWHELMELKKKKPLVASVGGMAASGGYYLACAANKIVSEATSIVGSIGVVGGKVVIGGALSEVGVNGVTFPASDAPGAAERAAYLSALQPWSDATRERVRSQMAAIYELFLQRVAAGRSTTVDAVRPHAEGRIWSGVQGKERGLVDELGGIGRAIVLARQLGGLDLKAPVAVEGASESLFESLLVGPGASAAEVEHAVARARLARAPFFAAVPVELRAFVDGLSPLLHGETTLTVLPYPMRLP